MDATEAKIAAPYNAGVITADEYHMYLDAQLEKAYSQFG
jgi:hypothetical protein